MFLAMLMVFIFWRKMISQFSKNLNLTTYLIADRPSFDSEKEFFHKVEKVVDAGIGSVQFRDLKNPYFHTVETVRNLQKITKNIPLYVNTNRSISLLEKVDACGVFLEQPIPVLDIRKIIGDKKIIGIPAKDEADVLNAERSGLVDYVSVKVFPSKKTAPKNGYLMSLDFLKSLRSQTKMKIVAIGGINMHNLSTVLPVLQSGDGIAMASGFLQHSNPQELIDKIQSTISRQKD